MNEVVVCMGFARNGRVQRVLNTNVVEPNVLVVHCSPKLDVVLTASVC